MLLTAAVRYAGVGLLDRQDQLAFVACESTSFEAHLMSAA